jgi:acetoin:2,6-dichlorophenolindophenol oxidoreductase subunit beta
MARSVTYMQAIGEALASEMNRDPAVIVFGEDNIGGSGCGGKLGCAWGPTAGLHEQFPTRVLDTPITEAAFTGAAIGAAITGLRPVVDVMFADFIGVCFDQILNQAAKLRYMTGGATAVPMVIRAMWGAGMHGAAQHSQALYSLVTHVPGLKVAVPATAYDAKGLMIAAIQDDDPVVFFEHKMLYFTPGEVPAEPYTVPFGKAAVVRAGEDCTVVALGPSVHAAQRAADELAGQGIECEIIDPRTTSPLDTETINASVGRTGRLVVAEESNPRCSVASDICALVAQDAFWSLRAPVRMVTAPHAPAPFNPGLENLYIPGADQIAAAVRDVVGVPVPA